VPDGRAATPRNSRVEIVVGAEFLHSWIGSPMSEFAGRNAVIIGAVVVSGA
jgi:hypothetical protein